MSTGYSDSDDRLLGKSGQADGYDPELGMATKPMVSFSMRDVRHAFLRKVFGILTLQLLVTAGISALFILDDNVKDFVQNHPGVLWSAVAVSFATIIAIACCPSVRKKHPQNLVVLSVFTLAEAYLVGSITAYYDSKVVLMAFIITISVTIALTVFALQTRMDFTMMGGVLLSILMSLIIFGLLLLFFPSPVLHKVYAGIGALLFSVFIVFDVQLMTGRGRNAVSPDEYVLASINLYLDIINLFLYVLALLGGRRN